MIDSEVMSDGSEACGIFGYATLIDGQWHASVRFSATDAANEGATEQIGHALRTAVRRAAELNRAG